MATPILDLPRHKLADVLDNLIADIRDLEKENKELKSMDDDWKDLFTNDWFKALRNYGDRWGIAHISFDGVSIAEIFDDDFDRLITSWGNILDDLTKSQS